MIKVQEKWLFRKYAQTWVSFLTECIRVTFKIQGIHATGFKRAQGNQHCAKSESHTNRVTFETNAIMMIVKVHPQYDKYIMRVCNCPIVILGIYSLFVTNHQKPKPCMLCIMYLHID